MSSNIRATVAVLALAALMAPERKIPGQDAAIPTDPELTPPSSQQEPNTIQEPTAAKSLELNGPAQPVGITPANAYRTLYRELKRELFIPKFYWPEGEDRPLLRFNPQIPELRPDQPGTGNSRHVNADGFAVFKGKVVLDPQNKPELVQLALNICLVDQVGGGDPMALTVESGARFSPKALDLITTRLTKILIANPYLAAIWNASATTRPSYDIVPVTDFTDSGLVMDPWVQKSTAPNIRQLERYLNAVKSFRLAAERLGETYRSSSETEAFGWDTGQAQKFVAQHANLLAQSEQLLKALSFVTGAPEVVAAAVALSSLASSPILWNGKTSAFPSDLYVRIADYAESIILAGTSVESETKNRSLLLARIRGGISTTRQFLTGVGEKDEEIQGALDVVRVSVDEVTELLQQEAARMLALRIEPSLRSELNSAAGRTGQILGTVLRGYSKERLVRVWLERATKMSRQDLSVSQCEPIAPNLSAALYGVQTLSPRYFPHLFAKWARLGDDQGALNLGLFLASADVLSKSSLYEAGTGLASDQAQSLVGRATEGKAFISTLTVEGIRNLVNDQFDGAKGILVEMLKALGQPQSKNQQDLVPGHWLLALGADDVDTKNPESRLSKLIAKMSSSGDLERDLQRIAVLAATARKILEEFPEGGLQYQAVRRAVLTVSGADKNGFITAIELKLLAHAIAAEPEAAGPIIFEFYDNLRLKHAVFVELLDACKGQGAVDADLERVLEFYKN